jgi:hypothetical protein
MEKKKILNQLLQGQRELLAEIKEMRKELEELKTKTEAAAYLSRDVLLLKTKFVNIRRPKNARFFISENKRSRDEDDCNDRR